LQQTTATGRAYDLCFFNGFRESENSNKLLVSDLGDGEERDAFLRCGIVCVAESN
jgi:hypothetical protein